MKGDNRDLKTKEGKRLQETTNIFERVRKEKVTDKASGILIKKKDSLALEMFERVDVVEAEES